MVFSLKSPAALSRKACGADDRFRVPTMRALAQRALLHALHFVVNVNRDSGVTGRTQVRTI